MFEKKRASSLPQSLHWLVFISVSFVLFFAYLLQHNENPILRYEIYQVFGLMFLHLFEKSTGCAKEHNVCAKCSCRVGQVVGRFKDSSFSPFPSQFVESLFCAFNMVLLQFKWTLFVEDSYGYYWFLVEMFQKWRLRKRLLRRSGFNFRSLILWLFCQLQDQRVICQPMKLMVLLLVTGYQECSRTG